VLPTDLLTLLLILGIVVLIISTTIMAMSFTPAARRRRRPHHPLSPSAAHTLAIAQARAATHAAESPAPVAKATHRPTSSVTGQIIDISDGLVNGRPMSVEYAQAIAEHIADTDPEFVAEVISQWIRADSTIEHDLFR
jgi:flagellar biosynthesis/type III secretory pathway M-ring protein FliF/YscJ